jgi:Tfp pilus assembly protein PilX
MFKSKIQVKKGVVLLVVLGTILLVVILANIILNSMSSQSRLTHHQVSRIQAYYAAQAGMNYALERLRIPNWTVGVNCTAIMPCLLSTYDPTFSNTFPRSISNVRIILYSPNPAVDPAGVSARIESTAIYTYSP